MRILLYCGKGGVGKTSIAAATGIRLASLGKKTLVMSVDPAHSLADSFDLDLALFHGGTSGARQISERLSIQEVNIQHEIKKHWAEISSYITGILKTSGLTPVEAEEMAVFPGMEELSALMYVNQYWREKQYEVIVLDCAPTAESLRFVSLPTTLDWYMKHIFNVQRRILKVVRPIANKVTSVELPPDRYFGNIHDLFKRIQGVDDLLEDPSTTSVRLVTNAEKMVLRETQRAFVYFSLHGLTVDTVVVNRVLPDEIQDPFFSGWRDTQRAILNGIESYFAPVPVRRVPLFHHEVLGQERLRQLAEVLYADGEDPAAVRHLERPYTFSKQNDNYEVRLRLPFASKAEVKLFKKEDELVVEIGTLRRHIGLPTTMSHLQPARARLEQDVLVVEMRNPS